MDLDEDAEIIVDRETLLLCRLCIKQKGRFQIGKVMQKNMKECFDITIDSFDGMSQIVCEICKKLVSEIVEVREKFRTNQLILIEKRKQLYIKDDSRRSPSPICIDSDGENKKDNMLDSKEKKTKSPILDTLIKNTPPRDARTLSASRDARTLSTSDAVKIVSSPKSSPKPSVETGNKSKTLAELLTNTITKNPSSTITIDSSGSSCSNSQENKENGSASSYYKQVYSDDSEDEDITPLRKKYIRSYNCRVCRKIYNKKNKIKEHIVTAHSNLYNQVQETCKPSSVSLYNSRFLKQTADDWVQLNPDRIIKFDPRHQLYFVSRTQRKDNNIIVSSSDEEDNVNLQKYKRILCSPGKKIVRKGSSEKYNGLFGNESDSSDDSNKSKSEFKSTASSNQLKVTLRKVCDSKESSRQPSEDEISDIESYSSTSTYDPLKDVSSSKARPIDPINLSITEQEVSKIIENCYKTAKIKKSLTAPIEKHWLIQDITNMSSLNVTWASDPKVKVSRISSKLNQTNSQDVVSHLPTYNSENKTPPQAHLKLMRLPPKPDVGTQKTVKGGTIRVLGKNSVLVRKDRTNTPDPEVQQVSHNMPALQLESPPSTKTVTKKPSDTNEESAAKRPRISEPPFMNPIIVSTVSLAKNVSPSNDVPESSSESNQPPGRPMIKCKPTSLLMPSPIKTTAVTNVNNNVKEVPPNVVVVPQPILHASETQNNSNPMMFSGYNLQINNVPEQNYVQINSTLAKDNLMTAQPQPPLLNPMIHSSSDTPALLSANNINIQSVAPYTNQQQHFAPTLSIVPTNNYMNEPTPPVSSLYPNMVGSTFPDMATNVYDTAHNSNNSSLLGNPNMGQANEFIDINSQYAFNNMAPPMQNAAGTILLRLQEKLKLRNVILNTCLTVPTKYSKLLRFVLTIKEKNFENPTIISREFIVEVCMQTDGVLVLNISDHYSTIDVKNWNNEFQVELVNALKKRDFLQTMKKVSCNMTFANTVAMFADVLDKFIPNLP